MGCISPTFFRITSTSATIQTNETFNQSQFCHLVFFLHLIPRLHVYLVICILAVSLRIPKHTLGSPLPTTFYLLSSTVKYLYWKQNNWLDIFLALLPKLSFTSAWGFTFGSPQFMIPTIRKGQSKEMRFMEAKEGWNYCLLRKTLMFNPGLLVTSGLLFLFLEECSMQDSQNLDTTRFSRKWITYSSEFCSTY